MLFRANGIVEISLEGRNYAAEEGFIEVPLSLSEGEKYGMEAASEDEARARVPVKKEDDGKSKGTKGKQKQDKDEEKEPKPALEEKQETGDGEA